MKLCVVITLYHFHVACVFLVLASVSDGLWALDKSHSLLRHSQLTVKLSEPAPTSSRAPNLTSDGDWEVV